MLEFRHWTSLFLISATPLCRQSPGPSLTTEPASDTAGEAGHATRNPIGEEDGSLSEPPELHTLTRDGTPLGVALLNRPGGVGARPPQSVTASTAGRTAGSGPRAWRRCGH